MRDQKECCGTCKFWVQLDEDHELPPEGVCRRYPPVPDTRPRGPGDDNDVMVRGLEMITEHDDWCGEHQGE